MQNSIKKVFGNIVAIFVVLILFLLIIPLSPGILDLLFLANITISLIILMITMHIKEKKGEILRPEHATFDEKRDIDYVLTTIFFAFSE